MFWEQEICYDYYLCCPVIICLSSSKLFIKCSLLFMSFEKKNPIILSWRNFLHVPCTQTCTITYFIKFGSFSHIIPPYIFILSPFFFLLKIFFYTYIRLKEDGRPLTNILHFVNCLSCVPLWTISTAMISNSLILSSAKSTLPLISYFWHKSVFFFFLFCRCK